MAILTPGAPTEEPSPGPARPRGRPGFPVPGKLGVAGAGVALVVAIGFVVYAVIVSQQGPPASTTSTNLNLVIYSTPQTVPAFTLKSLTGPGTVSGATLGRGPAVVNFFASWCTACQAEIGNFASVAHEDQSRLRFLGVDTNDDAPALARAMLAHAGAGYPVGVYKGVNLETAFGVGGLPTSVLIDARGRIVGEIIGKVPRAELTRVFGELAAGRPITS